jgi:hypothetical protein
MPANHASWLAISAFLPGFLCWHSFLAAGYGCSVSWLAMLTDCLYMLAGYLTVLARCLCWPAKLAEYLFPAGLICSLVDYAVPLSNMAGCICWVTSWLVTQAGCASYAGRLAILPMPSGRLFCFMPGYSGYDIWLFRLSCLAMLCFYAGRLCYLRCLC